jgi:hypothetical protein
MPACMIQRTVETQTIEPSSPVSVIRRQFQSQDRQSREGSVSSESSAESKRARRKTISKGIAPCVAGTLSSDVVEVTYMSSTLSSTLSNL